MKIKLPRYLSHAIAANKQLKRAMGMYLYLKAIDTNGSGVVVMDKKAKQEAALWLKCTPRNIENWLKEAQINQLITKTNDYTYSTISINTVRERYCIMTTGFYYIPLGIVPLKDVFLDKYLLEQYQRCETACKHKKSEPAINYELSEVVSELGISMSDHDLKNCQRWDYVTGSTRLSPQQRFVIFYTNPDYHTGTKKHSQYLGYKGIGSFAYQKRRLQMLGMIEVEKRKITIPQQYMPDMTTKAKRETKLGHHQYFIKDKTLNLFLADSINFMGYNNWKGPETMPKSLQK